MKDRNIFATIKDLPRNECLLLIKQISDVIDLQQAIEHFKRNNDIDATNEIFEFIIESENFNGHLSRLAEIFKDDVVKINQLFAIAIQPENFVYLAKNDSHFFITFQSDYHKKEIFKMFFKSDYNRDALIKIKGINWLEYFDKDERIKFYEWLLISENFNTIVSSHGLSHSLDIISKHLPVSDDQINKLCENIIDSKIMLSSPSILSKIFQLKEQKNKLFDAFCNQENCLPMHVSCFYNWEKLFSFGVGSDQYNKMFDIFLTPEIVELTFDHLLNYVQAYKFYSEKDKREKLFQAFIKFTHKKGGENLINSDDETTNKFLSLLEDEQLNEIENCMAKSENLPKLIYKFARCLPFIRSKESINKFIDLLLKPDNFRKYVTQLVTHSTIPKIEEFCRLCVENNKDKTLLTLIMQNFNRICTDISVLNRLCKYFPGYDVIYKQPTLKLAKDIVRQYGYAYKSGAVIGMFSIFYRDISIGIASTLNVSDGRHIALTSKNAINSAEIESEKYMLNSKKI